MLFYNPNFNSVYLLLWARQAALKSCPLFYLGGDGHQFEINCSYFGKSHTRAPIK